MDEKKFLEVKDLHVHYTSEGVEVYAVNGVSFSLGRGETLGLVGETGAGKTTIAKSILGVLPDPPAKVCGGEIWVDGQNLLTLSEKEMLKIRGDKIAMIFQDPMTSLNPIMTVGRQISEAISIHNDFSAAETEERMMEMLKMVGIPAERYKEYPHQFSGGMKQRVVIAMALACNPSLLLADEPTTALDVTVQAQILDIIKSLQERFQTAMVLITHDLGIVAETCDQVAVIYAGEIVESGDKKEIFLTPAHPYTEGLFGSIPKMDDDSKRLSPIQGLPPDASAIPEGCAFHPRCPYATEECSKQKVPLYHLEGTHYCRCLKFKDREVE